MCRAVNIDFTPQVFAVTVFAAKSASVRWTVDSVVAVHVLQRLSPLCTSLVEHKRHNPCTQEWAMWNKSATSEEVAAVPTRSAAVAERPKPKPMQLRSPTRQERSRSPRPSSATSSSVAAGEVAEKPRLAAGLCVCVSAAVVRYHLVCTACIGNHPVVVWLVQDLGVGVKCVCLGSGRPLSSCVHRIHRQPPRRCLARSIFGCWWQVCGWFALL